MAPTILILHCVLSLCGSRIHASPPSIYPSIQPSIHPFIRPSVHPSTHTFVHPCIHPSISLFIHSSIHPSVHPFNSVPSSYLFPFLPPPFYYASTHPFS